MTKKKIPYGISNFEAIKDDNCYYVDKTKYLELLEELNEKYLFFLRPRKFGKSLFISLLEYYYGIEYKDKFDTLFGEYYIGKNPTPKANSYYILRFDFSSIMTSSNEETFRGFRKKVIDGVKYFNNSYKLFSRDELTEILEEKSSNEILTSFFNAFTTNDDAKIYILIDEYDHFTNELISFRRDEFRDVVSRNGYVRKFYEAIKEGTGKGIVDRFFATDVTPVTLDSLTSGFNIGSDLTLDFRLNEMLG
ncbi:MAG: AAA family ATPase, partial [Ignavibacteriaceae bacterium]|nr:AAA family ATPase [Ignavibacteriaceae bacterium]